VTATPDVEVLARAVVVRLTAAGQTLATAESLTAGLVCAAVADVPGASVVLRGGLVAYSTDLKVSELEVPAELVAERGAVDGDVAAAMAVGAARRFAATHALATTGVAGPSEQDGKPVGTVFVAHSGPAGVSVRRLQLPGDRAAVRRASVRAALELLLEAPQPS
jgi:nicotinamide-nucleotide amidase